MVAILIERFVPQSFIFQKFLDKFKKTKLVNEKKRGICSSSQTCNCFNKNVVKINETYVVVRNYEKKKN